MILDAISPLQRVKITGQLTAEVAALQAASVIERVRIAARMAALMAQLGAVSEPEPKRLKNFGWDAVKLSSYSMEQLAELRRQVEAEHANPFDPQSRYTENGQPTMHLYDAKGRKKLDALAWAVTYKLQEKAQPMPVGRAPAGGTIGMNGEFYKGGSFLPNTTLPKQGKAASGTGASTGVLIEPGLRADAPAPGYKSIYAEYREFIAVDDGAASVVERPDAAIEAYVNEDVAEGRAFLRAAVDAYNAGMRWYKPGDITVDDQHRAEPEKAEQEIVEHVTGRGKVLRGVVRTDLTHAEAKAIDEYTFRKKLESGETGYFIREEHFKNLDK